MIKYNVDEFIEVCNSSLSMSKAASTLGIHFNTFSRIAKKLGCYKPNPGGKGLKKKNNGNKVDLKKILDGKHPQYQSYKLKLRLFSEGLKENKCEICEIIEWNGQVINCELDHIDGNRTNHTFSNLRILCPNCHSQTETFRSKNIK